MWKTQEIHLDYLLLDDTRIPRPFYMARSRWREWCENAIQLDGSKVYQDGYDSGLDSANDEIEDLEKQVDELEEEIYDLKCEISDLERQLEDD